MKRAMLIPVFGLLALSTVPAYALDEGECGAPDQMTEKFKAEGQHTIASADRVERENGVNVLYAVFLTINDDRSIGYIVQSDKDSSTRATKICIYLRLADVRLFDARASGVQTGALLKSSDEDGNKRCDALAAQGTFKRGACGPHNAFIRTAASHNEHVILQGFNVKKQKDGTYSRDGTLATVTGVIRSTDKEPKEDLFLKSLGGILYTSLPDGASVINATLVFAAYTTHGLDLLQQGIGIVR